MVPQLVGMVLLLTQPTQVFAQVADQNNASYVQSLFTDGTANGRAWTHFSKEEKLTFLYGVSAGEQYVVVFAPQAAEYISGCTNCTWADAINWLDRFYASDSTYLPIPVVVAFHYHATSSLNPEEINTLARSYLASLQQRSVARAQIAPQPLPLAQPNSQAAEPLHLNQVILFPARPNRLGSGCTGSLELNDAAVSWIDSGECQDVLEFSSPVAAVRSVVYEDWLLGKFSAAVWIARDDTTSPTHFGMTKGNARRLLRNLKKRRPDLSQRCFLASSEKKYEIPCDGW